LNPSPQLYSLPEQCTIALEIIVRNARLERNRGAGYLTEFLEHVSKTALCEGTTSQVAEKLISAWIVERFVSGHDFSRAEEGRKDEGF
jgi:hypothetical protein